MIKASMNALLADGWTPCAKKLVPFTSWPTASRIVMERGDEVLTHVYRVLADDSDWPGDDWPVTWTAGRLVPVTLFEVETAPAPERALSNIEAGERE